MRFLSAVVVNYRTPQDLDAFLDSWVDYAPMASLLTIVNVDPTEADLQVAREYANSETIYHLWIKANIGYGKACNLGANNGMGDTFAFFNADVVLTEGAVEQCVEALHSDESWGVLGPRQVNESGQLTHAGILGSNQEPKHRGWHARDTGQYSDVLDDVPTVSGAAYFIKRKVWEELKNCDLFRLMVPEAAGAFLPAKHYYNETWTSYHATAHGYKCVYYGPTKIIHKWHRASPMGGHGEIHHDEDQALFRKVCDAHDIAHN